MGRNIIDHSQTLCSQRQEHIPGLNARKARQQGIAAMIPMPRIAAAYLEIFCPDNQPMLAIDVHISFLVTQRSWRSTFQSKTSARVPTACPLIGHEDQDRSPQSIGGKFIKAITMQSQQ